METFRIINSYSLAVFGEYENFDEFKIECLSLIGAGVDELFKVQMLVDNNVVDESNITDYFNF